MWGDWMDYFYHGTGDYVGTALDTMIKIIESGGIKSKNKQRSNHYTMYNGDDHISVAKWSGQENRNFSDMLQSSFYGWIFGCPTFIISPDIEAIHAKQVKGYFYDFNRERLSEFIDEWHVKDEIPLDKIVGIALPFNWSVNNPIAMRKIGKILEYAKAYNWKVFNSDIELVHSVENDDYIYRNEQSSDDFGPKLIK